jgi:hypothetical protein
MFDIRHTELNEQLQAKLQQGETSKQIGTAFRSIYDQQGDAEGQRAVLDKLDPQVVLDMILAVGPFIAAMEEEQERNSAVNSRGVEMVDGQQFTYCV